MTQEDIIRMAREAGFCQEHINIWMCTGEDIKRFAALVRADEREACAKIAYGQLLNTNALLTAPMQSSAAYQIGVSIRARGQA
jgi:hypothetical protein